uniref:Uncharacterized protein n=1 Tax=Pristionchus pacificus TaxID=54126 RepID=A0A2A6BKK5_PRIPA
WRASCRPCGAPARIPERKITLKIRQATNCKQRHTTHHRTFSSLESSQSLLPSHLHDCGMHLCSLFSSSPPAHVTSPSHSHDFGMHSYLRRGGDHRSKIAHQYSE